MSVFDNIRDKLLSYFNTNDEISSDWIKINDKNTSCGWTIEDFPYNIGVDENLTEPHCWRCVSVNQCWFKNEEEKKPKEFDYAQYSLIEIPQDRRGLYHPNCHCKKYELQFPQKKDVDVIMPIGKVEWLFTNKSKLTEAWGYHSDSEREKLVEDIIELSKKAYISGRYKIREHTGRGVNATFFITIHGINEKVGHTYNRISSYMIFPNGRIKNNTPIGDKWKDEDLR